MHMFMFDAMNLLYIILYSQLPQYKINSVIAKEEQESLHLFFYSVW